MNLIFLDIDGVLNRHEPLEEGVMCGKLYDHKVFLLNHILKHTDARIVLSSAWRYLVHRGEMNLTGLGWLLRSHGIMNRLVGITREDTIKRDPWDGSKPWQPCDNERGQQISDYLLAGPGSLENLRYVVIDDLDLGISAAGHPFIKVDGTQGLQWGHCEEAIKILKG